MHPYRKGPRASSLGPPARTSDERIIYGLAALLGSTRVVIGLVAGEWFGAELTIAAILMVFGLVGLLRA